MSHDNQLQINSVGEIYQFRILDGLVEIARGLAYDSFDNPYLFRDAPDDIGKIMSEFSLGMNYEVPSATERSILSRSLTSSYVALTNLRREAIQFVKNPNAQGSEILKEAFLEAAKISQESLKGIQGQVVSEGHTLLKEIFDKSLSLIKSKEIIKSFGAIPTNLERWPLRGDFNIEMAYTCQEMARRVLGPSNHMTQQRIINFQRIAYYGSLTIDALMHESFDSGNSDSFNTTTIRNAYMWALALQELVSRVDIIRAWKEADYRRNLLIVEEEIVPPHPSGEAMAPGGAGLDGLGFAAQSYTVHGEVCCCSGDNTCGTHIGFGCDEGGIPA